MISPLRSSSQTRQLVQPVDVRFRAGFDYVGRCAAAYDFAAVLFELHGDFAQGLGAAGYGADVVAQEFGGGLGDRGDGLVGGVDGAVADGGALLRFVFDLRRTVAVGMADVPL